MKKEKMNPLKTIDLSCNFLLIGIGLFWQRFYLFSVNLCCLIETKRITFTFKNNCNLALTFITIT